LPVLIKLKDTVLGISMKNSVWSWQ